MMIPGATYRIQLSPEFPFSDLQKNLDYLERLGVTTLYSAPFFQARKGSSHGYDIIDPFHINREIGTLEQFRSISHQLKAKGMSWLQDIVPNHMAYDGKNEWLQEIFELGPQSPCCHHFDIDWHEKKVLAPFLGNPLEKVLKDREITLKMLHSGFVITYYDNSYPISRQSYGLILKDLKPWNDKFSSFEGNVKEWKQLKEEFIQSVESDNNLQAEIKKRVESINNSGENLEQILDLQYFQLAHWKVTEKKINYRRFFTINHLICLRMEDPRVFHSYHSFIEKLVEEDLVQGLRVDHIDGLSDPFQYLLKLRTLVGSEFYLIIEKILEWDEKLPDDWPVEGTSGYSFLAQINQVMTDTRAEEEFSRFYNEINPSQSRYDELVYKQKLFILKKRMGGEYHNLWNLAKELKLVPKQNRTSAYHDALGALLAAFPVYRIYPQGFPLTKEETHRIQEATKKAEKYAPDLRKELKFWTETFLGETGKNKEKMFSFLQRCQQFTGPLAAKGVEDTSFYIFNRLISHNEVGDSPENFGLSLDGFHERMKQREREFPLSINATATHDTKRGEDARMRINVLSEFREEWLKKVGEWLKLSGSIQNNGIPDDNETYFIFQMLVGHYPFSLEINETFLERSRNYLQKVLREAKVHSSWAKPDPQYEQIVFRHLEKLLKEERFLSSFLPLQKKIMAYGALKSLSQCVLKSTAPGIPDIYQGCELWDLSYVDPDNRRPVDYVLRERFLTEVQGVDSSNYKEELRNLKTKYSTGKIKLFCLHKLLDLRKGFQDVFDHGSYIPLKVRESLKDQVLAYAREEEGQYIMTVVPVLVTKLFAEELSPKKEYHPDPVVNIPSDFPRKWQNIFTGEILRDLEVLTVKDLFQHLPVCVLKSVE